MDNKSISKILRNIAAAYTIKDENKYKFQIIAYQKVSDIIGNLNIELKDLYKEQKLNTIPGIGPTIRQHLEELFTSGRVNHFDTVTKDISEAVFPLLDIPTFGPKKANKLVSYFHLNNKDTVITDIKNYAEKGEIAKIPSFGEKSQEDILRAIDEYSRGNTKNNRMVLPYAMELADRIINYLKRCKDVIEAYPLGSLRRMKETIGDIDIAVATNNPNGVIDYFINYPSTERIIEKGDITASILVNGGKHIDLMVQAPESFGSLLQHFSGSKEHNIALREYALKKGLSLSEYGIKVKNNQQIKRFTNEIDFYHFLGLDYIPPEIREDHGEIQLSAKHNLPHLVELKDIQGDLHLHSNFQIEPSHDLGVNSFGEMIHKAQVLHYSYVGFAEHNPSISNHSSSQIYDLIKKRNQSIEHIKLSNSFVRTFKLLEVDILASGQLAVDDNTLHLLDTAIVSIHSAFSMSEAQMTDRIIHGLSHDKAKILAHPTGRVLNSRPGYNVNWTKLFNFMKENNKALEINAWPNRLDLPDYLIYEAHKFGIKFVINTDSHASYQMDNMIYGVALARRGWCSKEDILNTYPYEKLKQWLQS